MTAGRLLDAIGEAIVTSDDFETSGNVIVTEYIVLASFIESDGERAVYCDTIQDQSCSQSLGLLAFGTAIETKRAAGEL